MGVIRALDHTGDSETRWTPGNFPETLDAKRKFDALRAQGYAAFETNPKKPSESIQTKEFNEEAEEILMIPQMQGG